MPLPILLERLKQQKRSKVSADKRTFTPTGAAASRKKHSKNMATAGKPGTMGGGGGGVGGDVQVSPLRSLDDFLLESARFQVPNFRDPDKWSNRIFSNLLYYQTNYFLTSLVVFAAVGVMHPVKTLYGFVALVVAFGLFYYITNDRRPAEKFKRDHPLVSVLLVLAGGYFIVYMLGSVIVFLMAIMLPLVVIFMHSSMRLRNIKNKITNKLETVGLTRTPMGILLQLLGQEPDM